jgi:hypothetical protein
MQGPNDVLQIPGVLDIVKHFHENNGRNRPAGIHTHHLSEEAK